MPDEHLQDFTEEAVGSLRSFLTRPLNSKMINTTLERPLGEIPHHHMAGQVATDADYFSDYLQVLFGPLPANPSRLESVERLAATFAADAYGVAQDGTDRSHFEVDLEHMLMNHEAVAVIGNRGSGKTAWINHWLNRRTKSFFEQELKSNWFRIDVTKLYKIATDNGSDPIRMGMSEYFQTHTAYVFLEYGNELHNPNASLPDEISLLLASIAESIGTGDSATLAQYRADLKIIEAYYSDLRNNPSTREKSVRFPSETAIAELCRDRNRSARAAFGRVFKVFAKACVSEKIGIVAIIDGVDNVSWSLRDNVYLRMCEDAAAFIRDFETICPDIQRGILLVARPETIPQLRAKPHADGVDAFADMYSRFRELRLPVAAYDVVLKRKLAAARDSPAFNSDRAACEVHLSYGGARDGQSIFLESLDRYDANRASFLDQIRLEIQDLVTDVPSTPTSVFTRVPLANAPILSVMFDDNLRAMLNGFRRSVSGRARAVDLEVGTVDAIKMLEYLLLGGKLFVESTPTRAGSERFTEIPPGEVFPNIFWYDQADASADGARWHGLAGLRLLQAAYASPMAAGELIAILHIAFNYPLPLLLEHLEAFVAFGLLEIDPTRRPRDLNGAAAKHRLSEYRSTVRTSAKGRLVATLSMFWADWQYFLALDTPMHRYFLPEASGQQFVRFYRAPRAPERVLFHYADALVPTVATFLRHIHHYHHEETRRLQLPAVRANLTEACGQTTTIQNLTSAFEIPEGDWLAHCEKQIFRRLRGRRPRSSARNTTGEGDLAAHLVGVFRQDSFR